MKIKKIEFSRLVGVSHPAIYQYVKKGILTETVEGFIDTDCPLAQKYMRKRGIDPENFSQNVSREPVKQLTSLFPKKTKEADKPKKVLKSYTQIKKEQKEIIDVEKQTQEAAEDYSKYGPKHALELAKLEVDLEIKKLELKKKQGELIDRERTVSFLFMHLEVLHKQLLHLPSQLVERIIALVRSDKVSTKKDVVEYMVNNISKSLKDAKDLVTKTDIELQDAGGM